MHINKSGKKIKGMIHVSSLRAILFESATYEYIPVIFTYTFYFCNSSVLMKENIIFRIPKKSVQKSSFENITSFFYLLALFVVVLGFELVLTRQALYHLSHAPDLLVFS
jgi:hypothetical protein